MRIVRQAATVCAVDDDMAFLFVIWSSGVGFGILGMSAGHVISLRSVSAVLVSPQ